MFDGSTAQRKVTRILPGNSGEDKYRRCVLQRKIGVVVPIAASIAGRTLAEFRIGVASLRDAGGHGGRGKRGIVESIFCSELELPFHRERWNVVIDRHRTKIREEQEDPARLLSPQVGLVLRRGD